MPFGAFVQVGDGIEGLVHISEMSAHHVDLPEQVVTPGEELWVKIIDLDLQRRRISLSIKQAAEGGVVAAEYQEHFGEHAYDDEGNYIGELDGTSEGQEAWAEYYAEQGPTRRATRCRPRAQKRPRRPMTSRPPARPRPTPRAEPSPTGNRWEQLIHALTGAPLDERSSCASPGRRGPPSGASSALGRAAP